MSSSDISQIHLGAMLSQLGFREVSGAPDNQKIFAHKATDTIVVLSWLHPEKPRPGIVAGVRRLLDEKGVIDRDDFDALARQIKSNHAQPV